MHCVGAKRAATTHVSFNISPDAGTFCAWAMVIANQYFLRIGNEIYYIEAAFANEFLQVKLHNERVFYGSPHLCSQVRSLTPGERELVQKESKKIDMSMRVSELKRNLHLPAGVTVQYNGKELPDVYVLKVDELKNLLVVRRLCSFHTRTICFCCTFMF